MKKVQGLPVDLGFLDIQFSEYLLYQYYPIWIKDQVHIEPRLMILTKMLDRCSEHINSVNPKGFDYIYLTVKHQYQHGGAFNRPGWHIDGFGTDDINVVWSSNQPTVFNSGEFLLGDDEHESLRQMEEQVKPELDIIFPNKHILVLDNTVPHRVGEFEEGIRSFVKITYSNNLYNLIGNTINYELNYERPNVVRDRERNVTNK